MFGKSIKLTLKIALSAGVLWILLQKLDFSESIKIISSINIYVFILCLALYLLGQYISSIKWAIISEDLGFSFSIKDYISYYFTGMFFNLFLPTSVGGDVIKGYYLCKQDIIDKKKKAFMSVFRDRLTGAMTLVLISAIGIACLYKILPNYLNFSILFALVGVVAAVPLIKLSVNLWKKIIVYSLLFHFLCVLIHFILAKSLGLSIPVAYLLIIYPITAIASFLPVSLNGIGVREGMYVYLLSLIGVSYEQAFAYSVLWFLVMTVASLFSVVFYLKTKSEVPIFFEKS